MAIGQIPIAGIWKIVDLLISLDSLAGKFPSLYSECLYRVDDPFDVQVTWSKVKIKLLVFEKMSAQYLKLLLLDSY